MSSKINSDRSLRLVLLLPLMLLAAAVVTGVISYADTRQKIADDLNDAIWTLANDNRELWTRPDTIAALRHLSETTRQPLICRAGDAHFSSQLLRDEAYYTLTLSDNSAAKPQLPGNKIFSDSIILVPDRSVDGVTLRIQGFANCSVASVFGASDQSVPAVLIMLAAMSIVWLMVMKHRKKMLQLEVTAFSSAPSLAGVKLTPMQRRLTDMLLESPDHKVDKSILCRELWGNKSNAEESLYTLVKRTKASLCGTRFEIVCNRGDSYEIRVNGDSQN